MMQAANGTTMHGVFVGRRVENLSFRRIVMSHIALISINFDVHKIPIRKLPR
jgi:hypothetical protein